MIHPGSTIAHYEIVSALGKGGMGEVWRARDTKLDREVAIKTLPAEFAEDADRLARFEREAKLLASLNHPHIAAIHGFEKDGKTHFLVMELVEGETLADRIARGAIPVDEAVALALQIAEALEAAHERGVIHRDLKPANVKLSADGAVKVLDFGLAKALSDDRGHDSNLSQSPTISLAATRQGMILGTAAYMSPEQARGLQVDKRSDVWSFGCVFFEMLTGRQPFAAEDVSLTLAEVMKTDPDWTLLSRETPAALRNLLGRCLDKNVKKRLRDIGEARIVLAAPMVAAPLVTETNAKVGGLWIWRTVAAALFVALAVVTLNSPPPPERSVVTIPVPLPSPLTFNHAISPDGQWLAVSSAVGGNTYVFVRSLDSWEFRRLDGTVGATKPFWSPDNQRIGFFDGNNKLMTVDVSGGPAQEVADVPGLLSKSGAWGADDTIVVAPSNRFQPGPLVSVAASGGTPTPLTSVESGESHLWPSFHPDGRHFVYTAQGGAAPGIYLASLDQPTGQRILPDMSSALLAVPKGPNGATYVMFVRDGDLWTQQLDVPRGTLAGEATRLLEDIPVSDDRSAYVSASTSDTLAYFTGSYRETDSRYSWFDRGGTLLGDEGGVGPAGSVSLSPNGRTLVVARGNPADLFTSLWRRDAVQNSETPLTVGTTVDKVSNAVWSPDGLSIVYTDQAANLVIQSTRSAEAPRVLVDSDEPLYATDWSRDGRFLLFTRLETKTDADIWYVELERSGDGIYSLAGEPQPYVETPFLESAGQFTPDGQWVAYITRDVGGAAIDVRPFPSGSVAERVAPDSIMPRWSDDGDRLYYVGRSEVDPSLMSMSISLPQLSEPSADLQIETGPPERLFDLRINSFHPAWGTFFFDIADNGERLLINHFDVTDPPTMRVIVNWPDAFGLEP